MLEPMVPMGGWVVGLGAVLRNGPREGRIRSPQGLREVKNGLSLSFGDASDRPFAQFIRGGNNKARAVI